MAAEGRPQRDVEPESGEARSDDASAVDQSGVAFTPSSTPSPEDAIPTCHVIVRASSEDERAEAVAVLRATGLDPHEVWSTSHAVSYRVDRQDPSEVRRLLDNTDLGWTVVPPGEPDYMLHMLYVQGPDGRRFRIIDAPAQQTVGNIGSEVMDQYPASLGDRPVVIDAVSPEGDARRLNPDDTLHGAGVREDEVLRVGVEATAG